MLSVPDQIHACLFDLDDALRAGDIVASDLGELPDQP